MRRRQRQRELQPRARGVTHLRDLHLNRTNDGGIARAGGVVVAYHRPAPVERPRPVEFRQEHLDFRRDRPLQKLVRAASLRT